MNDKVYIAAPFFTKRELEAVKGIERTLMDESVSYFSPRTLGPSHPDDLKIPSIRRRINEKNLKRLRDSTIMIALIDRLPDNLTDEIWVHRDGIPLKSIPNKMDDGTLWECGYSTFASVPVILYTITPLNKAHHHPNIMLSENCAGILYGIDNLQEWTSHLALHHHIYCPSLKTFEGIDYR